MNTEITHEVGDRVRVLHNIPLGNTTGTIKAVHDRPNHTVYEVELDGGGTDPLYGFQLEKIDMHPKTECCGYESPTDTVYAVQWNPYNKVVQCHNCGHAFAPVDYRAKEEALCLARSIHASEYPDAESWEPLDTVSGLISQIDNMYAGIREQRDYWRMKAEELAALHP